MLPSIIKLYLVRKSYLESYTETNSKKRATRYSTLDIDEIRRQVAKKLKRNKTEELIARVTAVLLLATFLSGTIWIASYLDFKVKPTIQEIDKTKLFKTFTGSQPNGLELKTDYYATGTKAAETYYKGSFKHQNSESYYETGEQFRSALYFYDSLIIDIYFYKNRDTIQNFPAIADDNIHKIKLLSRDKSRQIEFDFYDGKILEGTYKEFEIK